MSEGNGSPMPRRHPLTRNGLKQHKPLDSPVGLKPCIDGVGLQIGSCWITDWFQIGSC